MTSPKKTRRRRGSGNASGSGRRRPRGPRKGGSSAASTDRAKNYKTEMCNKWLERGECPYGSKCQFAHGEAELRQGEKHLDSRYKQSVCRNFHEKGSCPYGKRCRFIHNETEEELRLLRTGVSPDKISATSVCIPTKSDTEIPSLASLSIAAPPMMIQRQNSGVQDAISREACSNDAAVFDFSIMKPEEDEDAWPRQHTAPAVPLLRQSTVEKIAERNSQYETKSRLEYLSSIAGTATPPPAGTWTYTHALQASAAKAFSPTMFA